MYENYCYSLNNDFSQDVDQRIDIVGFFDDPINDDEDDLMIIESLKS